MRAELKQSEPPPRGYFRAPFLCRCEECEAERDIMSGHHWWQRQPDGTIKCSHCGMVTDGNRRSPTERLHRVHCYPLVPDRRFRESERARYQAIIGVRVRNREATRHAAGVCGRACPLCFAALQLRKL